MRVVLGVNLGLETKQKSCVGVCARAGGCAFEGLNRHTMAMPAHSSAFTSQQPLARQVIQAEADALSRLAIDDTLDAAVALIVSAPQTAAVVITGLGKSGLIGQKLAATFASTGTPSHFVHATEASHGDLGRIRRGDVVLHLSNSGNTEEVVSLAEVLKQDGIQQIAITASDTSDLGRAVDVVLKIGDVTEACPHKLAPTASTTAQLAMGDALALCVMQAKEFQADDFHKLHTGGGLGKQMRPVTEAMRFYTSHHRHADPADANLPMIDGGTTIRAAYETVEQVSMRKGIRRAGALIVVDAAGRLSGIFTDGDLRRHVFAGGSLDSPLEEVMTHEPRVLQDQAVVRDAVRLVRELRIDEVPVTNAQGQPIGLIDVQDLVSLKVIEN